MKTNCSQLTQITLAALFLWAGFGNRGWTAPAFGTPPTSAEQRQYAPSREMDILHQIIDVTPDFAQRTISGKTTLRFKPIAKPLAELRLDGVNLAVRSVTATEKILGWQATAEKIIITFEPAIPPYQEVGVTIEYAAEPRDGLYFRTPEMGYKPGDGHLFTQGEAITARHWYPGFDSPNERFTTEVVCRVAEGMEVLSNGRLVSREKDAATGLVAVRWLQDKPHANYLVSLVAGHFQKLEDRYRDLPLAFWTLPSEAAHARSTFKDTKDMLAFFEAEIGVPYPWAKYDQVCVNDFVAGGMENTSITTLTDGTLHPEEYEPLRSSQGLVAHELAHQWFGDLVTCKDWSHLWLNEGFATYYEHLYCAHKQGRPDLQYRLYGDAKSITGHPDQANAMVRRDFSEPNEQFNHLNYGKGSWVLHMLRSQLGEDLYRRCIKTYLERHQLGNATTEDLNRVIEELSGRSFDRFFDQWVYHASQPELGVSYEWNERAKLAKISVRQDQKLSDRVLLFEVPLPIRFKLAGKVVDQEILMRQKAEDFYFSLPEAPKVVRMDPELTVLAKINFGLSAAMMQAQLEDQTDMLGRLMAVEQMGDRRDRSSVGPLQRVLNGDPFYGVRVAASQALRAVGSDEALAALVASRKQEDARVRRQVVADIGGFYREASCLALLKIVAEEHHPDIQATAIRALGAYHRPELRAQLLAFLSAPSFRGEVSEVAMSAIKSQDDPGYLEPLLACLQARQKEFLTPVFCTGLDALAWLARDQERKDAVREFLLGQLTSPRRQVQRIAVNALGTLGDGRAVAALEKIATGPKGSPERTGAERAIERIRASQKSAVELGALRTEVMTLQKDNRDLRRDMEDLKKKFEVLVPASSPAATNKPAKDPKAKAGRAAPGK